MLANALDVTHPVQTVPKFNAQFNPYTLPGGTDGWLAIVGTFGLWIALIIIVREALNAIAGENATWLNLTRRRWLKVEPCRRWHGDFWPELSGCGKARDRRFVGRNLGQNYP